MDDNYRWGFFFCNMSTQCLQVEIEQRQESHFRLESTMIELFTMMNEHLIEQSASLARNQVIIDQMVTDNEKTSGATIELDDSLSSKGNVGELHFLIEQGDNLHNSDLPIEFSCDNSFIVSSIMVYESSDMTWANDSYVETLPKEFLSLCGQAFEQQVEIIHSCVNSNKNHNSFKSHIGEEAD